MKRDSNSTQSSDVGDYTKTINALEHKETRKRKREYFAIGFLTIGFLAFAIAQFRLIRFSSDLPFINSIFFFALLNTNIVILLALLWLVLRNIGKVFLERRRRVMGAKLKTKLVTAFLSFSIIPTLTLFFISALYINSSFEKWFSQKIQNTLQASLEIADHYTHEASERTRHMGDLLSQSIMSKFDPSVLRQDSDANLGPFQAYLASQRDIFDIDGIEYYVHPLEERIFVQSDRLKALYLPRLAVEDLNKMFNPTSVGVPHPEASIETRLQSGSGEFVRRLVRIGNDQTLYGVLVVTTFLPVSLTAKADRIASAYGDYKDINPLKYPMKSTYFIILIMITLVILFVATWIGLFMARELTVPIERLVRAAREVGSGNLKVNLVSPGNDEVGVLVEAFNRMTTYLRESRDKLEEAAGDLEKRRLQLETILANIGTGVVALDSEGKITSFNRAAKVILELKSDEECVGRLSSDVFIGDLTPIRSLIEKVREMEPIPGQDLPVETIQWSLRSEEDRKSLAAMASPIRIEGEGRSHAGIVIVIDDLSQVLKAQREMAWREVARRIAHEIKNPLTPIKLSAQRMQRKLQNIRGADGELIRECTDIIVKHTDELRDLVNEFSNFARLPEIAPSLNDLSKVVHEAVSLYRQGHSRISFVEEMDETLPEFEFDRDQIKRVLVNLLENAVSALTPAPGESPVLKSVPVISVVVHHHSELKICAIEVSDNGQGMTDEIKSRIFEPYFSTKHEGTGLGLAIVKRIISDHEGFIRVYSNPGKGTKFLIELPTKSRLNEAR